MNAQLGIRARRRVAGFLLVSLLVILAGCSAAAATPSPAQPGSNTPGTADGHASGLPVGAPSQALGVAPVGGTSSSSAGVAAGGVASSGAGVSSGGGVAGSAPAIAYPYPVYPGAPGVAPDHTIVVSGTGQATVKADLSDQASAQQQALRAALADAKAQADAVASAVGVTISGVLSVSVTSGGTYAVPMAAGSGTTSGGSAPGATSGGPAVVAPAPVPPEPITQQLVVSVTVAYRIG
jgi:hypothetical protein